MPFHGFLIFFEISTFHLNIDELSSRVLQNRRNPGWLSTNTVAIATQFHGKLLFNLHILSIEIGFPWFCVEEISVQIPELVDRETIVRRNSSMVLHGNKIFPGSFWPYLRHYRDDTFFDRDTKRRKLI